jgi:hypothetical protein
MVGCWVAWKHFPDPRQGEHIEAPIGPGVYEVRDASTGRLVAFGHAANVASELTALLPKPALRWKRVLFGDGQGQRVTRPTGEFEYRTCSASSLDEARSIAQRLQERRDVFWRRRVAWA